MKVQLTPLTSFFIALLLSTLLTACGGSSSNNGTSYRVSVDQSAIEFINEAGTESDETIAVNVSYSGKGLLVGIPNDGSIPPWLNYQITELTDSTAVIEFRLAQEDVIGPETYTTQIRVSSGDIENSQFVHTDINVSLSIWQLSIDDTPVSLTATKGNTSTDEFDIRLIASNTDYTISSDLDWLSFSTTEAQGSGELETITATADYSVIENAGFIEGSITLTESTGGSSQTIDVALALDELYLTTSQSSVSFVKTANTEFLSQQVAIHSNAESSLDWQASSDASWLTLTPSSDGTALTITADESSVTAESLAQAQVTITTDGALSAQSAVIEVALYHSAATLADSDTITPITVNADGLAVNPLIPYVYLAVDNTIRVYHQYTLNLEATLSVAQAGLSVENLITSKDGKHLFAMATETTTDGDGNEITTTFHYHIDLATNAITELTDADISGKPVEHMVISGRDFIVTDAMEFAALNLSLIHQDPNTLTIDNLDFANATNALYITTGGADLIRFTAQVNDFSDTMIELSFDQSYRPENGGNTALFDIVVDDSDNNVYLLNGTTDWLSFDGESFIDNGRLNTGENLSTLGMVATQNKQPMILRADATPSVFLEGYNSEQSQVSQTTALTLLPTIIDIDGSGTRYINYIEALNTVVFYRVTPL
ncbi:BACON domain-containing protein [Thalassotalea sp. LPB0316]|uniref:BACON domain-containing protein n=1 Tax=Thalassotalea sp. LPB0316 TaxID=2769490 RepID=UPI001869207D|nr:BACON domain-containing protein [Thalassotalea sp. LPB0316]QOL25599.1 BACON domain-containing protein [Thalassotalea sp. LPB0316]